MDTENAQAVLRWLAEIQKDSYVERDKKLASIFMVPRTLKENDVIFTPQAISIGPYHFLKPHLAEMESEKSQILARAVKGKLPSDFFAPLQKHGNGGNLPDLQDDNFFASVVPRCRDDYGDPQLLHNLKPEAFALMLFRDASFLLAFLKQYVVIPQQKRKTLQSQQQSASDYGGPFHDLKSGTSLSLSVKEDFIKFENQIPLSALESLYAFIGDANESFKAFVAEICNYYSPFEIKRSEDPDLGSCRHLLHCVHATAYSKRPDDDGQRPPSGQRPTNGRSPFTLLTNNGHHPPSGQRPHSDQPPTNGWSPFTWLKNNCVWVRGRNSGEGYIPLPDKDRKYRKKVLPSALKLSKSGVKFRRCEGGIEDIRFDSAQSTLYLPHFKIGIMTEKIIRNLIAFELCSPEIEEKAFIGFTRLLDDLTQDAKDAELLRTSEIFGNLGLRDDKMVEIVKSLRRESWNPYCKPVSDAKSRLMTYYSNSGYKILWSEFLDTYCSKPWILISTLAATALLFMTAVQVLCLFYTCST